MKIDHLVLGAYETNCYILRQNETAKDCLIIDTGLESEQLMDFLRDRKLLPAAVILTHGHADHITGIGLLRASYPEIKVYIHKLDSDMLTEAERNLSALAGGHFTTDPADVFVDEPETITEAGLKLEILHTPGHTPGGICLYARDENILFSGDTLFADSVGRTDFPGGSMSQLIRGIKKKLCVLPEETVVYPGHGPGTTIEREKISNQYLR